MNHHFQQLILDTTGATAITSQQVIQTLWSGYGEIVKVGLQGGHHPSVIAKYIVLPEELAHPRGWNTNRSHTRKIKSYDVEMHWYQQWADRCNEYCRVARCYTASSSDNEHLIVMEDLDTAGYPIRHDGLEREQVKVCLKWLANFHARFMGEQPQGLWKIGTYWHLDTRPDELAAMEEGPLKQSASKLDQLLNQCRYQTLVHGDAKVANFCFSEDGQQVAAVDFQYVGGGCGMKDVAYFLGSCLDESQCEAWEVELLDSYFVFLREALIDNGRPIDLDDLEREWREMYAIAWTDFYRFLLGWMPGHYKIHGYTRGLAERVLG